MINVSGHVSLAWTNGEVLAAIFSKLHGGSGEWDKMEQFKLPSPLRLEGNSGENGKRWSQRFDLYLKATEADKKDEEIRVAILLHYVG